LINLGNIYQDLLSAWPGPGLWGIHQEISNEQTKTNKQTNKQKQIEEIGKLSVCQYKFYGKK
jgi:hypothetical protein